MDTRNQPYFGAMHVTGHATTQLENGPVTSLLSQAVKNLVSMQVKVNAAGERRITITICDKPLEGNKAGEELAKKLTDVEQGIDWDEAQLNNAKPLLNESFEDYYERQLSYGMYPAAAMYLACDWFEREQDPNLLNWMNDDQAKRFRLLNSSNEAYESALPNEYQTLKHYVISQYPQFAANILFREA